MLAASRTPTKKTVPPETNLNKNSPKKVIQPQTESLYDTPPKYPNKVAEARSCLTKAKASLKESRNTKKEIVESVMKALDRLFQLVKEAEAGSNNKEQGGGSELRASEPGASPPAALIMPDQKDWIKTLEEHKKSLKENTETLLELKNKLGEHQRTLEATTYASVTAGGGAKKFQPPTAMHSVMVTSKSGTETGDSVINQIRLAVNAKEGGVQVDRIRKAKDRKVIVGCRNQDELNKVKARIMEKGSQLNVEEIKNKDPLVILFGVLSFNSDEDIIQAIL